MEPTNHTNPFDENVLVRRFTRTDFEAAKAKLLELYHQWQGLLISNDEQSVITPDDLENIKQQAADILDQEIKSEYELEQLKILTVLIYLLMHANYQVAIVPDPDIQETLDSSGMPNANHYIVRKIAHHSRELRLEEINKLIHYENVVLNSYITSFTESESTLRPAIPGLKSLEDSYFDLFDLGYEVGLEMIDVPAEEPLVAEPAADEAVIEAVELSAEELEPLVIRDEKADFLINNYHSKQLCCGVSAAVSSYIGLNRDNNEDGIVVLPEQDKVIVIDAMGGYGNGVIARDLFVESLLQNRNDFECCIRDTQQRYDRANLEQGGVCIIGIGIRKDGQNFTVDLAQAGDVHAVAYDQAGEIKFETVDESIGHLVINAIIGKKATDAQRANGWNNFGNLTKTSIRAKPGWRIAIYSDGIGNHFKAADMGELIINKTGKQAVAAISKALDESMRKEGAYKDNSSIAIIDF